MTLHALVTYPPPDLHGQPACTSCSGHGVTGERYAMPGGEHPLLLDVFCPECGGCGHADHDGCTVLSPCTETLDHHDDVGEDFDEDGEDEACPSCHGRQWWVCQGFAGEGEATVMHHLRVPCGCTEDRAQLVER